ncbi:unnamed protein product [Blepharisma stoltei]|uniref:Uncharacterized protein n=1 Tax=Blepharisma stoltei TaxID=1481888 RepID=A0AAU9IQK2_9CILI|nr:unnamed protein product [Blepharisma stoltei]
MMEGNIKGSGKAIECMEKESLHGQMEDIMKEVMQWTKKKDMAFLAGLMERDMKDFGWMGNSMKKEHFIMSRKAFRKMERWD